MDGRTAIQVAAQFLENEQDSQNTLYDVLSPDTRTALHTLLDIARSSAPACIFDSRERQTGDDLYKTMKALMAVLPSGLDVDKVKDVALAMEDWACLRTDQQGEDSRV